MIDTMERLKFDHTKMIGKGESVEESLKDFGIACIVGEKETLFYYGVTFSRHHNCFTEFYWTIIDNDTSLKDAVGSVSVDSVALASSGMTPREWNNLYLYHKVLDVCWYYGVQDVFKTDYNTGLYTFEEITGATNEEGQT